MTDLNLTIAPGFADAPGNLMIASQWTTPLDEIETFLHGLVGRDGVGGDNWKSDQSVRGAGFRKNGTAEVFRLQSTADTWSAVVDTTLPLGPPHGIDPSPSPGGVMRFHLRANAVALWVWYQAKTVSAVGDIWAIGGSLDGAASAASASLTVGAVNEGDRQFVVNWCETAGANMLKGWHYVTHWIEEDTTAKHLVFGPTELIVVAAYK